MQENQHLLRTTTKKDHRVEDKGKDKANWREGTPKKVDITDLSRSMQEKMGFPTVMERLETAVAGTRVALQDFDNALLHAHLLRQCFQRHVCLTINKHKGGKMPHSLLCIACKQRFGQPTCYREGGGFRDRIFSTWNISQFMRNFPHDFQAAVRNKLVSKFSKIACRTVAFATH